MGPLTKEIPQIELKSIWEVIRLRWWIVPLCLVASAGLMFAQESDLKSSPTSITVSKIYGAKDETAALVAFGLDPAAIKEFPSFQNQLATVRAEGPRLVSDSLGAELVVTVTRAEPQVSMLAAADGDGKQLFTVSSNAASNYMFSCSAAERIQCDQAIDVYVKKVEEVRQKSISDGLLHLEKQIKAVVPTTSADHPELRLQATAIHELTSSITGELAFVSEITETSGGTISTVKVSTYLFALAVGLIVAILVILQLTVTDNKIRSLKRLQITVNSIKALGELGNKNATTAPTSIAASIIVEARKHKIGTVVLVPVGCDFDSIKILQSLQSPELSAYITLVNGSRIQSMSLSDLVESSVGYVLVVQKNLTTSHELAEAFEALSRSENLILGALLSDL
jgi:hypothetical protein